MTAPPPDDVLHALASGELAAPVDSKDLPEDALHSLREAFGLRFPVLHSRALDKLAAHAPDITLQDWLPHLAAALQAHGLALLDDPDDDTHQLRLMAQHQCASVQALAQQGHMPLARIAPAKEPLPPRPRARSLTKARPITPSQAQAWGLADWLPPALPQDLSGPIILAACHTSAHGGVWAIISQQQRDAPKQLWLSQRSPEAGLKDWRALALPAFLKGQICIDLQWAGADLLLAERNQVHRYPALAACAPGSPLPAPEALLTLPPSALRHGKFTGYGQDEHGCRYVQCAGSLWRYTGHSLQDTGIQVFGHWRWHGVPVQGAGMAWLDEEAQQLIAWDGQHTRTLALPPFNNGGAFLCQATPDWLLFSLAAPGRLQALLWQPATGARRALHKGSLGVADLLRWRVLPNGHAVVSDGQRLLDLGPVQALIDAAAALV